MKTKNYFQVILKNGKTHSKLYRDPARAIKEIGIEKIKMLREVLAEQVNTKYVELDGIALTEENKL